MKKFLSVVILLGVFFSFASCQKKQEENLITKIKKRGYLSVTLEPENMPFEMKAINGDIIGFDIDLITEFAKKLGVSVKIQLTTWDEIFFSLLVNNIEEENPVDLIISGMTITKERGEMVDFSEPYFLTGQAFLISKENPKNIRSWQDLNQEGIIIAAKMGAIAEYVSKKMFPKATLLLSRNEVEAANAVIQGLAHATVFDQPFIAIFAKKNSDKVYAFVDPFTSESFGIAVRKENPELLQEVNLFLKEFKESQKYKDLYQKYFVDMPWLDSVGE